MGITIDSAKPRRTAWLAWIVVAVLSAWYTIDWLRTLIYAIGHWGLWAGLIDSVAALRMGELLIFIPLALYLLVMRQDEKFFSRVRWLMWAGALLAGFSYLGLNGRIDWAPLALGYAFLGLLVPAFTSLKTGCAARFAPGLGFAGLIFLHLLLQAAGFLLIGYAVAPYPAPVPRPAATVGERQQQDVRYLGSELARLHMNAYHTLSEPAYWEQIARLEAAALELAPEQLALEMMRFVAGIGDGHTSFSIQQPSTLHGLPVDFKWFGDALYIRGISEAYPQAVGARVLKIGKMPVGDLYQAILPYVSYENDAWARVQSSNQLNLVELLVQVGAVDQVGPVSLSLETSSGEALVLDVLPMVSGQTVNYLSATQEQPFYLSQPERYFWYDYRPDSRTLYFRYAACVDLLDFRKMANELWELADEQPVDRLIIDLRGNSGGNTYQFDHYFLPKLNKHPDLNDPERLFVLIDRVTFSSASDHAAYFRVNTKATLIGEPTGGKPNGYGEVRSFTLPNSGAQVRYSTNYFQSMDIDLPSVEPDVLIYAPAEAVFNGQDPVLEYIVPAEDW